MSSTVVSVNLSPKHGFSKQPQLSIRLLEGRGVEGDAHCGETVQHLYLKRKNAAAPNRMQVHLLQWELLTDLAAEGYDLHPGDLGENIMTRGIDVLRLPLGTRLHIGANAVVELTGLRSPCRQIESFRCGLLQRMIVQGGDGRQTARAGVMAVVTTGGDVFPGDSIRVHLPAAPYLGMTMI